MNLYFKTQEHQCVFLDVRVIAVDVVSMCTMLTPYLWNKYSVSPIFMNLGICFCLLKECYKFQLIGIFYTFHIYSVSMEELLRDMISWDFVLVRKVLTKV